jgi:hypothetical protein
MSATYNIMDGTTTTIIIIIIIIIIILLLRHSCFIKGRDISITGRGGQYICETSRLPHFLDNHLTDGAEVVSLTRLRFIPQERFLVY